MRLLPDGITRVDAAMERLLEAEEALLAPLAADDRAALASTLRTLALGFEPASADDA